MIANHGTRHRPLSVTGRSAYGIAGTRSAGEVYDEVAGNQAKLTRLLGVPPRFFRSGTAYCDDIAARIVTDRQRRFKRCDLDLDTHSQGAGRVCGEIDREMLLGSPKSKLVV